MVIPAGVEPAIFWMRTRRPRPLDDGTTSYILSKNRYFFKPHALSPQNYIDFLIQVCYNRKVGLEFSYICYHSKSRNLSKRGTQVMIEKRPKICSWALVNESNTPLTKHHLVENILREVNQKGTFDASQMTLGITGYEKVGDYDKSQICIRNRVLRLKKSNNQIIVTTDNYSEYIIEEKDMRSWFEIQCEAKEMTKKAAAEAEQERIIAEHVKNAPFSAVVSAAIWA